MRATFDFVLTVVLLQHTVLLASYIPHFSFWRCLFCGFPLVLLLLHPVPRRASGNKAAGRRLERPRVFAAEGVPTHGRPRHLQPTRDPLRRRHSRALPSRNPRLLLGEGDRRPHKIAIKSPRPFFLPPLPFSLPLAFQLRKKRRWRAPGVRWKKRTSTGAARGRRQTPGPYSVGPPPWFPLTHPNNPILPTDPPRASPRTLSFPSTPCGLACGSLCPSLVRSGFSLVCSVSLLIHVPQTYYYSLRPRIEKINQEARACPTPLRGHAAWALSLSLPSSLLIRKRDGDNDAPDARVCA